MGKTKKTKPSEVREQKAKKTKEHKKICPECQHVSIGATQEQALKLDDEHYEAAHAGPLVPGTQVHVLDVLADLDNGDTAATVEKAWELTAEQVAWCLEWRAAHPETDPSKPHELVEPPASEPPNPDEPHELEEDEAVEPEALPVRKVEISTLIPGASVLERFERTLPCSLTEAELVGKRAEVYTAAETIDATKAQIAELKKSEKSVSEHQSVLLKLIRSGQENRSVKCEKLLEGRMVNVYRADTRERIESRAAMGHELQLTLTE